MDYPQGQIRLHHTAPFTDKKHVSTGAVPGAQLPPSNRLSCFNLENCLSSIFHSIFFSYACWRLFLILGCVAWGSFVVSCGVQFIKFPESTLCRYRGGLHTLPSVPGGHELLLSGHIPSPSNCTGATDMLFYPF